MLHRALITTTLAALLCSTACTTVRTVYDSQGNEVKDDEPGGEKDLMSTFEKRFDASFTEKKTKDGVPITTSGKVSSFQRELDDARKIDKTFATSSFDTGKRLDLRDEGFAGSSRRFSTGKAGIEKTTNTMYSTDLRPDFMNETHGISHAKRYSADAGDRSALEGITLDERNRTHYLTDDEPYTTSQENDYVQRRRNKTKQPDIIDYRDYYRQQRQGIRSLLGRDNEP